MVGFAPGHGSPVILGQPFTIASPPAAPTPEYGSSVNISYFTAGNYRDTFIPAANPNLFASAAAGTSFVGAASLPVQFNSLSYRDSFFDGSAFLPKIVQCQVQSQLGVPFNGINYLNTFFGGSAFLPNIVQGLVASYLGAPFNSLSYRDSYFDANPILPGVQAAPNPFVNVWLIQIR